MHRLLRFADFSRLGFCSAGLGLNVALVLIGCSSGNTDVAAAAGSSASAAGGSAGSGGATNSDQVIGSFQIKLTPGSAPGDGMTTVLGKVYDGPTPETLIWELVETSGDCSLSTPRVPFCQNPCGGSAACVDDDECLAYPSARGVGTVTVAGVQTTAGSASFAMAPVSNTYQPAANVTLVYPPFAAGDSVSLSAGGDFFPAFSIVSLGIAPLVSGPGPLPLASDQPLELTWTKGTADATVHVKLDVSHHGGSKGKIECDTPDDGSLSIAAPLLKKLLDLGVAGYPSVIVTRRSSGVVALSAGRVELVVSSTVEQPVTVEGLTSCTADEHCPSGQTCRQTDLTCK